MIAKENELQELSNDFIQLARTALSGRQQDVQLLVHRASKRFRGLFPEMSDALVSLLQESPTRASPLRKQAEAPLPVDIDSRLQLLRMKILLSTMTQFFQKIYKIL